MNKDEIREKLKKIRDGLPDKRRTTASKALFHRLIDDLAPFESVLSFVSFQSEIDTTLLNHFLARTGRLYLPRITEDTLEVFKISDLKKELKPNSFGLFEPDHLVCKKVSLKEIQIILVPAIGFDGRKFRIGYGKGYYDRFLSEFPGCKTIGIGFKEQLVKELPVEKTDVSLSEVSLF